MVPFSSSNLRFQGQPSKTIQQPGPGQYDQKTLIDDIIRKPWGKQGVFGATEKRFVEQKKLVTPGPGNYNPLASINMLQQKSEANIKRSSSMFLSQAQRDKNNA